LGEVDVVTIADAKLRWLFLSNAYWGEDPDGLWTLELTNSTENDLSSTWSDFTFTAAMGELSLVPEPAFFGVFISLGILPLFLRRRRR